MWKFGYREWAFGLLALLIGVNATAESLNVMDCGASGSKFETTATTTEGSNVIVVADPGDFMPGQGIMVSRCNVRLVRTNIYGPGSPYSSCKPLGEAMEVRGYDGSQGNWLVYILEIDGINPLTFRWSDDLVRGYKWKGTKVPITWDWQTLSQGIEVKFNKRDLQLGHMISFTARDLLVSRIEKIEGNKFTLKDTANRTVKDAVVRHTDSAALQEAINRAIKEKRNLFFPVGYYRLTSGLYVCADSICIEGASSVDTILDISEGTGACFTLHGGTDVTIRNFRMIGHTGLAEQPGSFTTSSGHGYWCCALKSCNAVSIIGTERVVVENVHAHRMASEAFYSQGPSRTSKSEPKQYTKSITYLRCSVTDCAANAFNNNDLAENTSVLYCRIDGAGWHAWEGPSRFIRLIGNYVRNAGPFTVGDMSHRLDDLHHLGCGQAVVKDNVFEGIGRSEGVAINHGSTQVIVSNNLFINYNGPAITASSVTVRTSYPSQIATISNNIIDMTYTGENPTSRTGITVTASNVIVSNNQVYVRGKPDPRVTGIKLSEPALNVTIHDNLVRNCGTGIRTGRVTSRVTEVVDSTTFLESGLPLEWKDSHLYKGWNLAWLSGAQARSIYIIDSFDPDTLRFKLTKPCTMRVGDSFNVFPQKSANWNIHNNIITGCLAPVVLDSYGSETSFFKNNIITRGDTTGVKCAVEVRGNFKIVGNHISGFDEPGAVALALQPDGIGRTYSGVYQDNVFENCANVVAEGIKGLWEQAHTGRNVFIECPNVPKQMGTGSLEKQQILPILIEGPKRPVLKAKRAGKITIDGDVGEWPWMDKAQTGILGQTWAGDPLPSPKGFVCAAWDDTNLYLAVRIILPKGAKIRSSDKWGAGDGIEVSFQSAEAKIPTPIFMLWGTADGNLQSGPYGGQTPAQIEAIQKATTFAAKVKSEEWSCEFRIPFSALGLSPLTVKKFMFNIGAHLATENIWVAWVGTGGAIYHVDKAGDLELER